MTYHYYDYFKGPRDGKFYVRWHEGAVSGLYSTVGMTEEEAQRWVKILNDMHNKKKEIKKMPAIMTVRELIKLLSTCDENAMVCLSAGNECDAYLEIVSKEKHITPSGMEDIIYKTEKTLWTAG